MKTKKSEKMRASTKALKVSKANPQKRKLHPDPDGLFKRAAARGKKVIAMYDDLNPGPAREDLVANLLHDLMHLCDRDSTLGDFDEEHGFALHLYEVLVKESKWMAG